MNDGLNTPTVGDRLAAVGRGVAWLWARLRPILGGLGLGLVAAVWLGCFTLLRLVEGSKRATAFGLVVAVACLAQAWVAVGLGDWWLLVLLAMLFGALAVYETREAWAAYRRQLSFLAESRVTSRRLLLDGDLYRRLRAGWQGGRRWPEVLLAVAAALLLVGLWRSFSVTTAFGLLGLVCVVAGEWFAAWAVLVHLAERRHRVRFYLRGWRLADPVLLEARLAGWLPLLAPALAWRGRLTAWLSDLVGPWQGRLVLAWGEAAE